MASDVYFHLVSVIKDMKSKCKDQTKMLLVDINHNLYNYYINILYNNMLVCLRLPCSLSLR